MFEGARDSEVSQYTEELGKLKLLSARLERYEDRVEGGLQRAKSIFAPIHTLPPEILTIIFQLYVDEAGGNIIAPGQPPSIPANELGMVCAYWRFLTLATPVLWSSIEVGVSHDATPYDTTLLDFILSRSSNNSLSISITHFRTLIPQDTSNSLLPKLIPTCPRWSILRLEVDVTFPSSTQFQQIKGQLHKLRALEVVVGNWPLDSPDNTLDVFATAPKLTVAAFDCAGNHIRPLPWAQLESITVGLWMDCIDSSFTQLAETRNVQLNFFQCHKSSSAWTSFPVVQWK